MALYIFIGMSCVSPCTCFFSGCRNLHLSSCRSLSPKPFFLLFPLLSSKCNPFILLLLQRQRLSMLPAMKRTKPQIDFVILAESLLPGQGLVCAFIRLSVSHGRSHVLEHIKNGWGSWEGLSWRKGGLGRPYHSLKGGWSQVGVGLFYQATEWKEMDSGCTRRGSGWILGKNSSLKGWSSIVTGCPGDAGVPILGGFKNSVNVALGDMVLCWVLQRWEKIWTQS